MTRRKQSTDVDVELTAESYMRLPYARALMPAEEGGYNAEMLELPGCFSFGETPSEAFAGLEEAGKEWIAAALEQGQKIPRPKAHEGYSGRIALRLPKSLHRQAALQAELNRTSLNQFLVAAIGIHIGTEQQLHRVMDFTRWLFHSVPKTTFNIELMQIGDLDWAPMRQLQTSRTGKPLS